MRAYDNINIDFIDQDICIFLQLNNVIYRNF